MSVISAIASIIILAISAVFWYIKTSGSEVKHANEMRDRALEELVKQQELERQYDLKAAQAVSTPSDAVDFLRDSVLREPIPGPGPAEPVPDPPAPSLPVVRDPHAVRRPGVREP